MPFSTFHIFFSCVFDFLFSVNKTQTQSERKSNENHGESIFIAFDMVYYFKLNSFLGRTDEKKNTCLCSYCYVSFVMSIFFYDFIIAQCTCAFMVLVLCLVRILCSPPPDFKRTNTRGMRERDCWQDSA